MSNTNFYTHVLNHKGKLLVRGIRDGKRFREEIQYKPYMFVPSHAGDSTHQTLEGVPVTKKVFKSNWEQWQWIKQQLQYGDQLYGMNKPVYTFINDQYIAPKTLETSYAAIRTAYIDIEVYNKGMTIPDTVETGAAEVTAISLLGSWDNRVYVWGTKDYIPESDDITYFQFDDDMELLLHFVRFWKESDIDVVSGWNIVGFDIPFLINRLNLLFGEAKATALSPWGINRTKKQVFFGKETFLPVPAGISVVDYMDLYKKFTYSSQESYKLDWIANIELGIGKIDTSDYDSLYDLYDRNPQLHFEYNVRDTRLLPQLDNKLGFFNQLFSVAYDVGVNHEDAMTSVLLWDVITHNYLMNEYGIVVPHRDTIDEDGDRIEGGYVKDATPGRYKWVTSVDLDSLYPHLIMQYNMGPETLVKTKKVPVTVEDMLYDRGRDPKIQDFIKKHNLSLAPTGYMFKNDARSFFANLMFDKYEGRKKIKKKMLAHEARVSEIDTLINNNASTAELINEKQYLKSQIILLNNLQMALKIQLNSAYGAMANKAFRWFDTRVAESITKAGQLAIRWVAKYFNEYLNNKFGTKDVDYIVAMDTDSMYFTVAALAEPMEKRGLSVKEIALALDEIHTNEFDDVIEEIFVNLAEYTNSYEQKMRMKREMIADTVIWTGKKRYLLNIVIGESGLLAEPKLKVKGLSAVSSTTPAPIKKKLMECYKVMIAGDEKALHSIVSNFREDFRSFDFETIACPKGVNGVLKYDALKGDYSKETRYLSSSDIFESKTPPHVRGAIVYNRIIKQHGLDKDLQYIYDGDKIRYVYLKMPNPTFDKVISTPSVLPPQLGLEQYIDYDKQFEVLFYDPIKRITDAIGWTPEETLSLW